MIHQGKEIERHLQMANMSRKELALRTKCSEKHISTLINDRKSISPAFAKKLGYVFEDARYWLDLQARYEAEILAMQEVHNVSKDEICIVKELKEIYDFFCEKGYLECESSDIMRAIQLREILKISDLAQIPKITYNAAYKAQLNSNIKINPYVLFAWQYLCEKETKEISNIGELDIEVRRSNIPRLKQAMFGDISDGICEIQKIFAECGIAFQVVKNFRGAPVQGFIKETNNHNIIMCLTIRGKRADRFWFTLFHEIAHILNRDYEQRFVDFDSVQSDIEAKADEFAQNILIPKELYRQFISSNICTEWRYIVQFARSIGIQPFIVLGRLQRDGILEWSDYSNHVVKYEWA